MLASQLSLSWCSLTGAMLCFLTPMLLLWPRNPHLLLPSEWALQNLCAGKVLSMSIRRWGLVGGVPFTQIGPALVGRLILLYKGVRKDNPSLPSLLCET